jgi:hypothetical protein
VEEGRPPYLQAGPVPRPKDWLEWLHQPITAAELTALRQSVVRGVPYGEASWMADGQATCLASGVASSGAGESPGYFFRASSTAAAPTSGAWQVKFSQM